MILEGRRRKRVSAYVGRVLYPEESQRWLDAPFHSEANSVDTRGRRTRDQLSVPLIHKSVAHI